MAVVDGAVWAVVGPVLPATSMTPLATTRAARPPSLQLTVMVRVVPVSAPGSKVQPVALLPLTKSAAATP